MEMAVELVELRRRYLRILPRTSPLLGAMTWWTLRATAPISFWIFPRATAQLRVAWPKLQNHFFFFEKPHEDATMPTKGSS